MIAKRISYQLIILIILFSLAFNGQALPVSAQTNPTLSFLPADPTVPLGNQVQLELSVENGSDVNRFDILINYDFYRLSLSAWEHGDYLTSINCTRLINQPGYFELVCEQVDQPEVDGDGVLLRMTFDTQALGYPDVTITEAYFYDLNGAITYPTRRNSLIEITNDATFTPTPSNTPTSTVTSTATVGPSPTPTSSPTATSTTTPDLSPSPQETVTQPAEGDYPEPVSATATITSFPIPTDTPQPDQSQTLTLTTPEEDLIDREGGDLLPSRSQSIVKNLWRVTLWGVVIFAGLVILGTIIFYIRRRIKRGDEEDLLL